MALTHDPRQKAIPVKLADYRIERDPVGHAVKAVWWESIPNPFESNRSPYSSQIRRTAGRSLSRIRGFSMAWCLLRR